MTSHEVLSFWFEDIKPNQWWEKSAAFDALIATRFGALHAAASRCELNEWRDTPSGRLAEIIVLDQFSRNIFRDQAQAFACDPLALALAQHAVSLKVDQALEPERRAFLYMPFMHSESRQIHVTALMLFSQPGLEHALPSELRHQAIIDRFGRYPHRNRILGRPSSEEEERFLATPGSSF